jgi:hypothetical protein
VKRISLSILLMCVVSLLAQAQAPSSAKPLSPLEQTLVANEKNLIEAKKKDGEEFFKRALAADFVLVSIDGQLHEQQDAIDELDDSDLVELTPYSMKVLPMSDDAAIVTYDAIFREAPKEDEGPQPRYQHFSSLWVKQGDQWKLKFHQTTAAHYGDW